VRPLSPVETTGPRTTAAAPDSTPASLHRIDRLLVRERDRLLFLPVDEIDWIGTDRKYLRIHLGDRSVLMRGSLTALNRILDPGKFYRINRSVIINIERINELRREGRHFTVVLKDDTAWIWSPRYRYTLKRLLSAG